MRKGRERGGREEGKGAGAAATGFYPLPGARAPGFAPLRPPSGLPPSARRRSAGRARAAQLAPGGSSSPAARARVRGREPPKATTLAPRAARAPSACRGAARSWWFFDHRRGAGLGVVR